MLTVEARQNVDKAWDSVWSAGVTNPIVVSDLLGTLLMAGVSADQWGRLSRAAEGTSPSEIADSFIQVRRSFGIDPGSEIEAPEFWTSEHVLTRAMDLIGPVIAAHGDILGDIYEHILAKLSLAGHFGQFRTPRHIVDFMVAAVDPKHGEIVADPACGSGGFLVAASDYRKAEGRGGSAIGIEIDRTIARIALANTVFHKLESGEIIHGDGLTRKMPEAPDIVLANPPFAGSVSNEVSKRFASGSSRTELLFVEAISNSLAVGGRAAVVVPSGVITGGNGAARYVRQHLLEENTLTAVIELPSGVFRPYSDVKTAILLWQKVAPVQDATVKMIRLGADGFSLDARRVPVEANELPAALRYLHDAEEDIASAEVDPVEIVKNEYNLNPSRYLGSKKRVTDNDGPTKKESLQLLKQSVDRISAKLARIEELIS